MSEDAEPKPPLRLVPKPQGYELRNQRCQKTGQAQNWTPGDALWFAANDIQGKKITQLVAYWWVEDPVTGDEYLHFANATTSKVEHAFLLQKALHELMSR